MLSRRNARSSPSRSMQISRSLRTMPRRTQSRGRISKRENETSASIAINGSHKANKTSIHSAAPTQMTSGILGTVFPSTSVSWGSLGALCSSCLSSSQVRSCSRASTSTTSCSKTMNRTSRASMSSVCSQLVLLTQFRSSEWCTA